MDRGTGVLYQFHPGVHPINLENLVKISDGVERELRNWVSFLCSRTVMGAVRPLTERKIKVRVQLELDDAIKESICALGDFNLDANQIGYPFPYQVIRTHGTVDEIDNAPPEKKHYHARRYSAIQKRWTVKEFLEKFTTISEETKYKLEQYMSFVDGYLTYSTDVFKEINQRLGGRTNLMRYGIRIAVDGVPQGRVIDLSLTSSQGLDRQTHIVIAFNRLELDLGRKISADEEIAAAIREIGNKVVNVLKEYRWAMKKKDRPDVTSDLEGWQEQVENRVEDSIYPIFCEKLNRRPVFEVDPDSENEVVALFTWLCSERLLEGYKIRAISGFARYDALMAVASSDSQLRDTMDPLSIRANDDAIEKDWAVCEFKQQFADLIQDFDDKKKNPAEIDIVICWHVNDVNCRRGRLEMCYGDANRDHRPNYGASYIWRDDNDTTSFPVIALRNVLLELLARHELDSGVPGIGADQLNRLAQRDKDASI